MAKDLVAKSFESITTTYDASFLADYEHMREDLARLYQLAKDNQWDGAHHPDIDWSTKVDPEKPFFPEERAAIYGTKHWAKMTPKERQRFGHEYMAWTLSQFLHGEQGALMATCQIVDAVPNIDAKLYGSTQVVDEARHVEVYDRYLHESLEIVYPVNSELKTLLDQILTDSRWDMKYLGMQILVEGLALAAFQMIRDTVEEPLIREITRMVMKDEARHVAFGVLSLKDYYSQLSASEISERVEFTYEASRLMRDRLLGRDVYEKLGMDVDACIELERYDEMQLEFRQILFAKIVPNVKKLGLLTPELRKGFEELGVLQYEHLPSSEEELYEPGGGLESLCASDEETGTPVQMAS